MYRMQAHISYIHESCDKMPANTENLHFIDYKIPFFEVVSNLSIIFCKILPQIIFNYKINRGNTESKHSQYED